MAVWKSSGRKPPELHHPDIPEEFSYLVEWLRELSHPISYGDLRDWCDITGRSLARWEIETLMKLDRIRAP